MILKRLRTLADVRDSGRRERWRQHKALLYSLDSTASAPPIKHNPMRSTTSDRNRRNPSFIVFSDDEDDDDTKKLAKPEPKKQELEPEPSQPHHYMAHVPDDIMSAILSRIPWKSISRLQCVSLYWVGELNSSNFMKKKMVDQFLLWWCVRRVNSSNRRITVLGSRK